MIKYIMRKTIYKEFDKESQDMLLQLSFKHDLIVYFCFLFWGLGLVCLYIPILIIRICEGREFSMNTQIVLIIFYLIYFFIFFILLKVFENSIVVFSLSLAEKIYFFVCTTKGKALSKEDLKNIKRLNEKLYEKIEKQMCRGYCYAICFEICKALKKGYIEFIAAKHISTHDEDEKAFTMHVLYINNGWAFDTFSGRQFPIEQLHEIYKAKVYKIFSFDEISSCSYEEFKEEQEPNLAKWCKNNDCSEYWKGKNDKENT